MSRKHLPVCLPTPRSPLCPFLAPLTPAHSVAATLASLCCKNMPPHLHFRDSALGPTGPENQMATFAQEPALTTLYAALKSRCRLFIYPTLILFRSHNHLILYYLFNYCLSFLLGQKTPRERALHFLFTALSRALGMELTHSRVSITICVEQRDEVPCALGQVASNAMCVI